MGCDDPECYREGEEEGYSHSVDREFGGERTLHLTPGQPMAGRHSSDIYVAPSWRLRIGAFGGGFFRLRMGIGGRSHQRGIGQTPAKRDNSKSSGARDVWAATSTRMASMPLKHFPGCGGSLPGFCQCQLGCEHA